MAKQSHPDAGSGAHIIALDDDLLTAEALVSWRGAHPHEPVVVVFGEPETAALYREAAEVTALAWLPVFARRVASAMPPSARASVSPPPIVIGDGRVARYLTAALVESWAEPGQPLDVHCVGADPGWAQEADAVVQPRGRLTWSEIPLRPVPVVRRVAELAADWEPPVRKRADPAGPTVVVALEEADGALSIAAAVAASVPQARVGVVVPHADQWPSVTGVTVFETSQAWRAAVEAHRTPSALLVEQLLAEVAWLAAPDSETTRPEVPIFAPAASTASGEPRPLADQSPTLRSQLDAVAAALPAIVEAGALELAGPADRVDAIILTPGELLGMAEEILRALQIPDEPGARHTAVELAHLMPGIASRAGRPLRRPAGYAPALTFEDVERLAPLVHLVYQDVSAETGNATDSPLAGVLWEQLTEFERAGNRAVLAGAAVGHALLGLDWRASTRPKSLTLGDAEVERLAELEHRRWAIHQRRNGATAHEWMKPWEGPEGQCVTEGAKEYDRRIVRQVIGFLSNAGVEVFET